MHLQQPVTCFSVYTATNLNSAVESVSQGCIYRGIDQAAEKVVLQLLSQRSISSSNCKKAFFLSHTQSHTGTGRAPMRQLGQVRSVMGH